MKKYKRIGWVVEWRSSHKAPWLENNISQISKTDAITGCMDRGYYQRCRRKGNARCVPVLIEVKP